VKHKKRKGEENILVLAQKAVLLSEKTKFQKCPFKNLRLSVFDIKRKGTGKGKK
jgi:hypothetical protein